MYGCKFRICHEQEQDGLKNYLCKISNGFVCENNFYDYYENPNCSRFKNEKCNIKGEIMKIGDRVIVNGKQEPFTFDNEKGKIVYNETFGYFGIEFDNYMCGHDCFGKGKPGYCYNVKSCLCKLDDPREKIYKLEKEIAELKKSLNKKYEPIRGNYLINMDGSIYPTYWHDMITDCTKVGRAFDTEAKAKKAIPIMVEHDIILKYVIDHAPDYKPNYEDCASVYFNYNSSEWVSIIVDPNESPIGEILMPHIVANKLVDDLNNSRIEGM